MRTGDPFEPHAGTAGLLEVVDRALSVPDPDRADDPSDGLLAAPFLERSPALAAFAEHRLDERLREVGRARPTLDTPSRWGVP